MDAAELDEFTRCIRHATEACSGSALDVMLDELGWREALAQHPRWAISVLFERQGAANAASSALEHVLRGALGLEAAPGPVVVLPASGRWEAPGAIGGAQLSIRGFRTSRTAEGETTAVVVGSPNGHAVAVVKSADLTLRAVEGMDRSLGLTEVTATAVGVVSQTELPPGAWPEAVRRARLALGHELVGVAAAMLDLARAHAVDRMQFGRKIGAFQAVSHRLAESLVAVEAARAALDAAWTDGSSLTAAMGKAIAGRGARTAGRHCQQVLAGMGFTAEHPFHRYLRRALVLDELFGSTRSLTRQLGQELLANRQLPPPTPL